MELTKDGIKVVKSMYKGRNGVIVQCKDDFVYVADGYIAFKVFRSTFYKSFSKLLNFDLDIEDGDCWRCQKDKTWRRGSKFCDREVDNKVGLATYKCDLTDWLCNSLYGDGMLRLYITKNRGFTFINDDYSNMVVSDPKTNGKDKNIVICTEDSPRPLFVVWREKSSYTKLNGERVECLKDEAVLVMCVKVSECPESDIAEMIANYYYAEERKNEVDM